MTDIVIDGLRLSYGNLEILKGVSFSVEPGQIVALLGASGSGKTTLLRAVAGLETPNSGKILLGDKPLFDAGQNINLAPETRGLGLVFQSYALWPHRTVSENVGYPLKLRKVSQADVASRVQKALDSIGLGKLGERYPHQLSGGQQQRVALARALVYEPNVILLDEPLSNLDAKLREEARIWLRRLITNLGLSALCVTHDQVEAMALADRILLLNGGQIEQDGTPKQIYNKPESLFAAEFMGASNRLDGVVTAINGNRAEIVANGIHLVGSAQQELTVGAKVTALVRLERVTWSGEDGPGRIAMTCVESLFLGDRHEVIFESNDLTIRTYSRDALPSGQYYVEFPFEDLMVFAAE
ncbi:MULTISPECIES: ABC transporter ATP-binding protein [unclassified Mesorhizobium]|uniref:ABC transporter ATP-binding protein n=1 Tax=unclassified Mesorhizobium TaxID=325217 RepID=UPI00333BA365